MSREENDLYFGHPAFAGRPDLHVDPVAEPEPEPEPEAIEDWPTPKLSAALRDTDETKTPNWAAALRAELERRARETQQPTKKGVIE